MITIREAVIEDYAALRRLNKECLGYDYADNKTKARLEHVLQSPEAKVFVACVNGVIVGYIHAENYECLFQDCRKNILSIAVDSGYQKQGIGSALIVAVEAWAKETGAAGVRLVSGSTRTEAHAFYKAQGYITRKEQKNFTKCW